MTLTAWSLQLLLRNHSGPKNSKGCESDLSRQSSGTNTSVRGNERRVTSNIWGLLEMIITTTPNIEGKRVIQYLGLVTGEAVMGANMFKDMFASIRDIVGGRSGSYEKELRKARDVALRELEESANDLGANAVVGVDIDYEVLGQKNGMLMVSVSGTAVKVG